MKQSIQNLSNIRNNNHKYILLGDMLELGKKSSYLHKKLSPIINNSKISKTLFMGLHYGHLQKYKKKEERRISYNINQILKTYYFLFYKIMII